MNTETLITFPKPYTSGISKKFCGYCIIFEDSEILSVPISLGIPYLKNVVGALNGAYLEGYLQKERELGIL